MALFLVFFYSTKKDERRGDFARGQVCIEKCLASAWTFETITIITGDVVMC